MLKTYFNTSHVTVYLCLDLLPLVLQSYFNTSHVTVYLIFYDLKHFNCYNFNTSHVTVYQDVLASERLVMLFQYISCYCLSALTSSLQKAHHISIHLMLLFIGNLSSYSSRLSNFNTSHVTVYR